LKELKDATNAEGKNWIAGLLREPHKWTTTTTTTMTTTTTTTLALALAPQVRWRLDRLSCRMLLQLSHHS